MNKVSAVFLYYCTLFAVFPSVSGFLASRTSPDAPLFQLIFVPITLYLLFTSFKTTKDLVAKGKSAVLDVNLSGRKTSLAVFFLVFALLLGIALKNIFFPSPVDSVLKNSPIVVDNTENTDKSNALVFKKDAAVEGLSNKLTVVADTPDSPVNIRQGAGPSFPIIGRARDGQEVNYGEIQGEWYQILLEDSQKGYINKKYIKLAE